MVAFFIIGEKKTRPGVYFRYENYDTPRSQEWMTAYAP